MMNEKEYLLVDILQTINNPNLKFKKVLPFQKGASPAVHKNVETLQQPELQLIEEKIPEQLEMGENELVMGVGAGVASCITLLVIVGLIVRHSNCGRRRGKGWLSKFLLFINQ